MILDPIGAVMMETQKGLAASRGQAPVLNSEAQVAAATLDKLGARFRDLPDDAVPVDAQIEYDAIVDKHLPGTFAAHHDARLTVAAGSADANTLDHAFAQSLDRRSTSVDRLLDSCGANAHARFKVERRFIEMRHLGGELSV